MKTVLRLLLASVLLILIAAGLQWLAAPSPDVVNARKNYQDLRIGMSEAEANSVLGKLPSHKNKVYGEWFESILWYATILASDCPNPGPNQKLYDWHQWDFGTDNAWVTEDASIGMLLDKGKVICFWYNERPETGAERRLKKLARRLSINASFLQRGRSETSHDHREKP